MDDRRGRDKGLAPWEVEREIELQEMHMQT